MKNNKMRLFMTGLFLCAAMPVLAQGISADEKKLDKVSFELDKDGVQPEGAKIVTERLQKEFKVDEARVQGLRDQKLGYGEISIVLALAKDMQGGITDANVQKIMVIRQGPPVTGWGNVASQLGVKLGPVTKNVKKISSQARKHEAKNAEKKEKNEKKEKLEKHERNEKMEKIEKMEKPERPDNPGKGK
jgi:hypothetical protein